MAVGIVVVSNVSVVEASNHNWGSGMTYRECTNGGLTNYGPKTGQKWIDGSYKNLYQCTAPTTAPPTTSAPPTTAPPTTSPSTPTTSATMPETSPADSLPKLTDAVTPVVPLKGSSATAATAQPCTGSAWSTPQTANANWATLTTLEPKTLYRITVRSILGSHKSDWSGPVFTYPTIGPLSPSRSVANFRFSGYWHPPVYSYKFCSDTVPTTTTTTGVPATPTTTTPLDWEPTIRGGIAKWQTATDAAVKVRFSRGDCDTDRSGALESTERTGTLVWIASDDYVRTFCTLTGLGACVVPFGGAGQLSQTLTVIGQGLETVTNANSPCSAVSNAATHEAGHAIGIRGHNTLGIRSVMTAALCAPQPYDIVAIKALYQSQSAEGE